jgi:hypothetical protein
MRLKNLWTGVLVIAVLGTGAAQAAEVLRTDDAQVEVGGRFQLLGFAERLQDPSRSDGRAYLFLKQGRFTVAGNVNDWRFRMMMALGGEEEVKAPSPGMSLSLLDMYLDIPLRVFGKSYLRVGQFKVLYGRERLIESGDLLFVDRSLNNLAFRAGRDVGVAFHTQTSRWSAGVGVYTGGGRDIPERYLPQKLGTPMFALRAGYDNGVGEDVFLWPQGPLPEGLRASAHVNALYVKDSLVGHSTVLNTRTTEKPLVLNPNWNPYVARAPFSLGSLTQVGLDAALVAPAGPGTVTGEVEANLGMYKNAYGEVRFASGRGQVAYHWSPVKLALRYAVILPTADFKAGTFAVTGTRAIQELTPAATYTFRDFGVKGFGAKLVADLPVQIGVPVFLEPNVGAYVATAQPDQASLLTKGGTVARQNVVAARLMLQAMF